MLDRREIRENPDAVKDAVRKKGIDLDVDELLDLDRAVRKLQHELDQAQARRKSSAKEFAQADDARRAELRAEHAELEAQLKELREQLAETTEKLNGLLLLTPTIPWEGAPVGPDESANVVIRTVGTPPEFGFKPLDHVELLEKRGWADFARARKVAGERAYALTSRPGPARARGALLRPRPAHGQGLHAGQRPVAGPGGAADRHRHVPRAPRGDVRDARRRPVPGGHRGGGPGRLPQRRDPRPRRLPIRYAGISPCFRREAGSAGRDVRGLLRVHQFEKVEQFVICAADVAESDRWHAELLGTAEQLLQGLGLAYQVMEVSTGDMGAGKYRMNDINTWMPSLGAYRETHSCSSLLDWQARRANVRYRDTDGTVRFAYTLNNTAVATPRMLAALVENFQTSEAQVRVPEVLRPYLGGRELL